MSGLATITIYGDSDEDRAVALPMFATDYAIVLERHGAVDAVLGELVHYATNDETGEHFLQPFDDQTFEIITEDGTGWIRPMDPFLGGAVTSLARAASIAFDHYIQLVELASIENLRHDPSVVGDDDTSGMLALVD